MINLDEIRDVFKPLLFILVITFCTNSVYSQPTKRTLEEQFYMSVDELTDVLNTIKSAPILNEGCQDADCEKVNAYLNSLSNLNYDIIKYYEALNASKTISKDQWFMYLNQTFKDENLKIALITNHRLRDAWTNFASGVLDLASVWNLYKTGRYSSSKGLSILTAAVATVDGTLSGLNIVMKGVFLSGGTSFIGTITSDEWNNMYSKLRGAIEFVSEGLALYKKVDDALGLSPKDLIELKRNRRANIAAAILQLTTIYLSNDNKKMKDHINELDKILMPNQATQSLHYDKYVLKRELLDILYTINSEISLRHDGLAYLNRKCKNKLIPKKHINIEISERKFGHALMYFRKSIKTSTSELAKNIVGIEDCNPKATTHQFLIKDGLGKSRTAYIEVTRDSDQKSIYIGSTSRKSSILSLYPDTYTVYVHSYRENNIESKEVTIKNIKVDESIKEQEIPIIPYGRVSLKVVDKNGKPVSFRYEFFNEDGITKDISFTSNSNERLIDLPADITYSLDLGFEYNYEKERKENIIIIPKQLNKLHYVYDEGKFIDPKNAPNLSGVWITKDFECNNEKTEAKIKITQQNNYVKSIKISESDDFCIPKNHDFFEGQILGLTGSVQLKVHSLGSYDRANDTFAKAKSLSVAEFPFKYKIINANELHIGKMVFKRLE